MAEVKVLIPGYTSADVEGNEDEKTCATITLVKDKNIIMIVDPGVLENQKILVDALEKEGLGINDVTHVFLTHPHPDHFMNVGMFPNAKVVESFGIWYKDTVNDWEEQFTRDMKIIKTPGHDSSSLTLLVKTDKGVVAICGDVFWWASHEKQETDKKSLIEHKDIYSSKPEKLKESRKKMLKLADYIIPGHGDMFKVEK